MNTSPSLLRQAYFLLIYLPGKSAVNKIRFMKIDNILKNLVLLSFGLGLALAEFAFFNRFWELLMRIPMGIELLLPRFISLTTSFFMSFVAYSSILTAISVFYRASDQKILLSSPLRLPLFILFKSTEVWWRSCITLVFLSLPPVISFILLKKMSTFFFLSYIIHFFSLALFATTIGILAGMSLMALFPTRRIHQTIAIIGLCIAVLLITGMRFLHLESLWTESARQNPLLILLQDSSWLRYSPGMLFSKAMMPLVLGTPINAWYFVSLGVGILSLICLLVVGSRIFLKGWFKIQETWDTQIKEKNRIYPRINWLPLSDVFQTFMWKDWLIFRRDPSIWTQVFMMIPLGAIYLLNLSFLPLDQGVLRLVFAVANIGLVGLIVSAIGARFLFPAASREGRQVWVITTAPISPQMRIIQKGVFSTPPVILLGGMMLLFSNYVLKLPLPLFSTLFTIGLFLCIQLSWLAVLLGFIFPTYTYKHLLEVSLGKGALLFMVLAMIEIGAFEYLLWLNIKQNGKIILSTSSTWVWLWALTCTAITLLCFQLGKIKSSSPEI